MSQQSTYAIAVIGIDIGKNSFHVVGQDRRGAIVLRQKWSRAARRGSQGVAVAQASPLASVLPGHALTALSTARGSR